MIIKKVIDKTEELLVLVMSDDVISTFAACTCTPDTTKLVMLVTS